MEELLKDLKEWIKSVDKKLDNHLIHAAQDTAEIRNDVSWLKKFFWVVAASSIGALITGLFNLLLK